MKKFILSILLIITLFSSVVLATDYVTLFLEEGDSIIITVDDKDYFIEVDYIDEDVVLLDINGENLPLLEDGEEYTLVDGTQVFIWDVDDDEVEIELLVEDVEEEVPEVEVPVEEMPEDEWDYEIHDILWDAFSEYKSYDLIEKASLRVQVLDPDGGYHTFTVIKDGKIKVYSGLLDQPDFEISFTDYDFFEDLMHAIEEQDSSEIRWMMFWGGLFDEYQIWQSKYVTSDGVKFNEKFRENYCPFVKEHISKFEAKLAGVSECWDKPKEEKPTAKELLVGNFRSGDFASIGGQIRTSVAIENTQGEDLEDVVISLSLPDLGLRQKGGPIDIDDGDSFEETFIFTIEEDVEPGYYPARLVIESNGVSLVDHREVWIE